MDVLFCICVLLAGRVCLVGRPAVAAARSGECVCCCVEAAKKEEVQFGSGIILID